MQLSLKTPPSQEVLTLGDVKSYLRIFSDHEDDFLKTLLISARAYVENVTGRALLKQKWEMRLTPPYPPSFPLVKNKEEELVVMVPRPPLLSVEAVRAGGKDVPYTVEETKVALSPLLWGKVLSITFWAGYGETPDSLPPDLKMAVLMTARFFYEGQKVELPLLAPYKVLRLL